MEASALPIKLIVGLGNPGREYARTRHNVGFMAADLLALQWRMGFNEDKKWKTLVGKHDHWIVLKPQTFMNLSGEAIHACAHFYKIYPSQILLIYDDVSLPLGKLRLRSSGSAGGHNGIKSTIQHLGTDQFPRIKIGIGGGEHAALTGHVLGKFSPEEQETLDKSLDRAVEAVKLATLQGWAATMQRFNTETKSHTRTNQPPDNPTPTFPDNKPNPLPPHET